MGTIPKLAYACSCHFVIVKQDFVSLSLIHMVTEVRIYEQDFLCVMSTLVHESESKAH